MKAIIAAFNQEKALVGAFSVIIQLSRRFVSNSTQYLSRRGGMVMVKMCDGLNVIRLGVHNGK